MFRCRAGRMHDWVCFAMLSFLLLAGCASDQAAVVGSFTTTLMDCPNVYAQAGGIRPYADLPQIYQVNPVPVFYITDRMIEASDKAGNVLYGSTRDSHIAFGEAKIQIGTNLGWEALAARCVGRQGKGHLEVSVASVRPITVSPGSPRQIYEAQMAKSTGDPQAYAKAKAVTNQRFNGAITDRLRQCNRREVFVFVHGINTTFEQSLCDWTQIWHYLGREGVPLIFSWPSGGNGLKTYFIDSDAGDTSSGYLKRVIASLSQNEQVDKISLVGHSRGCDIVSRALLELAVANNAQGKPAGEGLKLNNVLLLAPDVDVNFFKQRVIANNVLDMPRHFTVYLAENDKAIILSRWLRSGINRLGQTNLKQIPASSLEAVGLFQNVSMIISHAEPRSWSNHSYYLESPSVSSDLVLLLRYNLIPGRQNGRPLREYKDNIWILEEGYPFARYALPR